MPTPNIPNRLSHLERAVKELLREELARQNLTYATLADRCDISKSCLWQFLSSEAQPRVNTVERVASALGLRMEIKFVEK